MVKVTVEKTKENKSYGYQLRHNQTPGFKGIIGMTWGWYRYKSDATERANELMKCWN
jgi:hypothetical protein